MNKVQKCSKELHRAMVAGGMIDAPSSCTVDSLVGLSDCLDHINIALNYWYPLESQGDSKEECDARHMRLFKFRDRLATQLKANTVITQKDTQP